MKILRSLFTSLPGFKEWVGMPDSRQDVWDDHVARELRNHRNSCDYLPETEMDRLVKTIEQMKDRHVHQ